MALGRSSCSRQILKSEFFTVHAVELRSAHTIAVPRSIALGPHFVHLSWRPLHLVYRRTTRGVLQFRAKSLASNV